MTKELQPCDFMNRKFLFYHVHALRQLAKFVGISTFQTFFSQKGANAEDLAFVNNATMGFNTVIRSLDFAEGDSILSLNLGYGIKILCTNKNLFQTLLLSLLSL
jgi:hypothetical protein